MEFDLGGPATISEKRTLIGEVPGWAGKLNGPPEDCGGIPGFYGFPEAIADPKHPDHEEMKEWYPGFDPLAFSTDEINERFVRRKRARR